MAASDLAITVQPTLSSAEIDDVSALVREAKWNQVAADWRIFLELGTVYAAHTSAGRIVATTATLPFGGRFAWISMVLVAPEHRRRGLATRLVRRAMDDLAAAGLVPALDATPDGREVYRGLGFTDSWSFHRLLSRERPRAMASAPVRHGLTVRPIADTDWPVLVARDTAAFGADRSGVLARLRGRLPAAELVAEHDGRFAGFLLGRDGRVAAHLGPLIAQDDATARALLAGALDRLHGPVFIDLADAKAELRAWLDERGFAAQRPFTRMLYCRSDRYDDPTHTFAVVGAEFG
jgi:GNAT superfamily N-acetyltransferase